MTHLASFTVFGGNREIEAAYPGASVFASPYPNLPYEPDSEAAFAAIAKVHAEQLTRFSEQVNAPVSVIGHSLGGHFAMRLLKSHTTHIERVFLIHPFLRRPGLQARLLLGMLSGLRGRELLHKLILRSRKALERLSDELRHVSDDEVLMSLKIVSYEDHVISKDHSPLSIEENLKHKIKLFYTKGDMWCSPAVIQSLRQQTRSEECHEPHNFITSAHHRQTMFERLRTASAKPLTS